jgi:pimeloyl-ACP methyl ester carboxylesterase
MLPLADVLRSERPVLAPDFPGHGRAMEARKDGSPGHAGERGIGAKAEMEFSIERFSDAALAVLDRGGVETADIFGYSMGGYVGLHLARRHPVRVGAIVTLGTKFAWDAATAQREVARLDPDRITEKVPAFAAQLRGRHGEGWARVVSSTAGMMLRLGASPGLSEDDFRSIPHRALIAVGDRDSMVSIDETIRTARALPAGECLVLPGTPHPFEQVDAGVLAFHIRQFFSKGQPR